MRRMWKILLLAGVFAVVLGTTALAAEEVLPPRKGMYDIKPESGVELTAQTKDPSGNVEVVQEVTVKPINEKKDISVDAARLAMNYTGATTGEECLIIVTNKPTGAPKEEDIVYIDQATVAGNGAAAYNLYPKRMSNGETYHIYASTTSKTMVEIGSFSFYSIIGDPSNDGTVDTIDVSAILRYMLGKRSFSATQKQAGDLNQDTQIDTLDVSRILRYMIGKTDINA